MSELQPGDVVQLTENNRPGLIGAFVLVEEVKRWGITGFIHHVDSFDDHSEIHLRLLLDQFERIGHAVMVPGGED